MNISNDVIIEILSRLPAKSLLRLRWACKYLFDLITRHADNLIKMHLHRSTSTISPISDSLLSVYFMNNNCSSPNGRKLCFGYYLNYYNDTNHHHHHVLRDNIVSRTEVMHIDHPSVEEYIHSMLGSSNGLILLMLRNKYLCGTLNLCILNPCTKEYKLLRRPMNLSYGFSYDKTTTYGFGCDETMDDYKVIRISHYKTDMYDVVLSHSEVEVYSLGTSSWRWIGPCPYQLYSSPGVFMNGALYWMDFWHENIISFDLGKEEFQHVAKTPNLSGHLDEFYKLQVFEGSLCLVLRTTDHQNSPVEIWVMKDYNVNNNNNELLLWTKLLTIPDIQYFPIKLVRYIRNGEILILNNHKDLVLYDPKNSTSDLKTLRRIGDGEYCVVLEIYTESLVSLNSRTYASQERMQICNKKRKKS